MFDLPASSLLSDEQVTRCVRFVGGNADRRAVPLTYPCTQNPQQQVTFMGSTYLYDAAGDAYVLLTLTSERDRCTW